MNLLEKPDANLNVTIVKLRNTVFAYRREGEPVSVFTTANDFDNGFKIINENEKLTMPQVRNLFALYTDKDKEKEIDGDPVALKVFELDENKKTAIGNFKYAVVWETWEWCGTNTLAEAILGFDQAYDLFDSAGVVCGPILFTNKKLD
jgi:hypothetical protein